MVNPPQLRELYNAILAELNGVRADFTARKDVAQWLQVAKGLGEALQRERYQVHFIGQFGVGKSSLINLILRDPGVLPLQVEIEQRGPDSPCDGRFLPGGLGLFAAVRRRIQAIMVQDTSFPDMETGYTRYRGLLFDALARLARQGFTVQPADVLDLIQDFFVDSWEGLAARYDPAYGPAASYVYGAFVRFARQRILRLQKWRSRLLDLATLADQVAAPPAPSPLDALVRDEQVQALQAALAELLPEQRTALQDYFTSGPRSQRQLARKYGVSRYRLHELLINGLGQLIVRLAAQGALPLPDREVALALWCEGCGLEETAARLGRPVQQVRQTRDRLAKLLSRALGSGSGGSSE